MNLGAPGGGKNFLITGGAGFIGVNLIRTLAPWAREIRVLDNLSAGWREDLTELPVSLYVGDIRDREAVEACMAGVEVVVHLAAHTGVVPSVADPVFDQEVNIQGTLNLLMAAVRHGVERFLFASTGGAIVGGVTPPVHEGLPPRPLSPYGAAKLAGEGYCSAFWGSYGLKTVILRFSNIYGPWSRHKGSVIATFCRRILRGEPLTIYGDGTQTRDFLFVGDLCRALGAAVQAEVPFGEPIQLGSGRETSLRTLLHTLEEVVGKGCLPPVVFAPPRPGEVFRNYVSIAKAKRYLGFEAATPLRQGLKATWEWFQREAGDQTYLKPAVHAG
uniref:NAD-dependent epimerase/dehydratase family protein n=1 Tax=Desulfobacca acetoxidans TaxID=60893 RepID=A0A7V4G8K7_9BACT